jgi:hypothetical protein
MAVTLYPNGVSNALIGSLGAEFIAQDPTRVSQFFDDFYTISAATGTTAAVWRAFGSGTPVAPTITSAQYGRALFAPVAAVTDETYIQLTGNPATAAGSLNTTFYGPSGVAFAVRNDLWFQTSFQISNATLSVINAGLMLSVSSAPASATDGIFFTKASGTTTVTLRAIKSGGGTTNSTAAITLADATDIKLGFHYAAQDNLIYIFVNDQGVGTIVGDNVPTVGLLPLIGHQNNTANRTSSWDYVFAAQSRLTEYSR